MAVGSRSKESALEEFTGVVLYLIGGAHDGLAEAW